MIFFFWGGKAAAQEPLSGSNIRVDQTFPLKSEFQEMTLVGETGKLGRNISNLDVAHMGLGVVRKHHRLRERIINVVIQHLKGSRCRLECAQVVLGSEE